MAGRGTHFDPKSGIRIRGLHKYYGRGRTRTHVLKGVDLDIEVGEFVSLIGTSGSGKTTLLNIMGGLDRVYDGTVEVAGRNMKDLSDKHMSRLRNETMGFIFQQFNLLPHITCAENVMLPAYFSNESLQEGHTRARKLLTDVGIGDKFDDRPTELSGGQRQRVAIARALFNQPLTILCDEPTGSLDTSTGQQILQLFRKLNVTDRITFIIVTHDEKISQACDRIIRIEDGNIIADERPERADRDALVDGSADDDAGSDSDSSVGDEDGDAAVEHEASATS